MKTLKGNANAAPILLITGAMAAGKSSVAQHIAEHMQRSLHLRGDVFRRMLVNGRIEMSGQPSTAALDQLMLRYRAAAASAKIYSQAGFNVVYQDVILGPLLNDVVALYTDFDLRVVVLCPSPDAIAQRERERNKTGYTNITIDALQQGLVDTPKVGLWVDSTAQTVEQTANEIMAKLAQAKVG